jgi:hypothetical protein
MKLYRSISPLMLIVFLSLLCLPALSQEDGILNQVYYIPESDQIIKVFEKTGDSYIISEGPYIGYPARDHTITVVFRDDVKKILEKDEFVEGYTDGNLITSKYDIRDGKTFVSCYAILKNDLSLKKSISFDGQQQVNVLKNRNIVVSDQYELYGTLFKVYNTQLQLLNTIIPFDAGFQSAHFSSSGDKIFAVVQQAESPFELKYMEIQPNNGSIIFQRQIENPQIDIVKILTVGKKMIIVGPTKLVGLSQGNISWTVDVTLPNYDIIVNQAQKLIYYCLFDKIETISADDGRIIHSINISDIYPESTQLKDQMIRPIIFQELSTHNKVILLLAETNKGMLTNESYKVNPKLYLIDEHGNVIEDKTLIINSFRYADVVEGNVKKVIFITDNQQTELQ